MDFVDLTFTIFPIILGVIFLLFIVLLVIFIIKAIKKKTFNDSLPKLSVEANVVSKRIKVSGGGRKTHNYTDYFATFEFESGDYQEVALDESQYGMLVENDSGKLTFQGSKFFDFERRDN